jgi:hypothetical protein
MQKMILLSNCYIASHGSTPINNIDKGNLHAATIPSIAFFIYVRLKDALLYLTTPGWLYISNDDESNIVCYSSP